MAKILVAGFEGENNSAKVLLDKLTSLDKLYLKNDFDKCALQIIDHIDMGKFRTIIAFGQKPIIKSIYIELYAFLNQEKYKTNFDYSSLEKYLANKGYRVKLSENAGNYLCNHVYASGLKHIEERNLEIVYVFMHIPQLKNIDDIDSLASDISEFFIYLRNA